MGERGPLQGERGERDRGKPGAVANEVVTEDKRRRKAWEGEVGEERSQAWTGGTDAAFIGVPRVPNGRSFSRCTSHVPGSVAARGPPRMLHLVVKPCVARPGETSPVRFEETRREPT